MAVEIFFALSGWLVGGILLKTKTTDLSRFYFNRAIRIWIPYFVTLILIVIASVLHKDVINAKWMEFVFYKLTFVYNLFGTNQLDTYRQAMPLQATGNHFWSVNIEEQFYLLAPLILVLTYSKVGKNIYTWIILSGLAYTSQAQGASIVFGVLAAVAANKFPGFYEGKLAKVFLAKVLVGSLIAFLNGVYFMVVAPWLATSMILLLAIKGNPSSVGKFAGGISYQLYMNAWIAGFMTNYFVKLTGIGVETSIIKTVLTTILTIAVASFLYWHIDRRFLLMRSSLYTEKRGKVLAGVAYLSVVVGISVGLIAN